MSLDVGTLSEIKNKQKQHISKFFHKKPNKTTKTTTKQNQTNKNNFHSSFSIIYINKTNKNNNIRLKFTKIIKNEHTTQTNFLQFDHFNL